MPTLEELCNNYGINPDGEGQEKIASAEETAAANSEASQISNELSQDNSVENENGGDMGLTDLYNDAFGTEETQIQGVDLEKIAEAEAQAQTNETEEMEKVAAEWDAAGRFMARGFFDELEKIAAAVEQQSDSEKIPQQLHAEGANKTQIDDDSKLAVNTPEARNANADALKEKKVEKIMGLKKGVNVSGQTGEDGKVAPDAAK